MKVLLHADGGVNIGLGHASRCSALWAALSRAGHTANVLVEPSSGLAGYLSRLGVPCIEAHADPISVRAQADRMNADLLIVDSYRWSAMDFSAVRHRDRPIVAFDDEPSRQLPVDAIINGAPGVTSLSYETSPHTLLWLGLTYQVIRDEFIDIPVRGSAGPLLRLIVLVGGDDPLGLLPVLAEYLDSLANKIDPAFEVQLICGPYAPPPKTSLTKVKVLRHPPDLRERMLLADLALSASGQTLYELARCGTPTIAFCTGEDQARNLSALADAGIVWNAGRADQPGWLAAAGEGIQKLAVDASRRDRMSVRAQSLIDGHGADRLAFAMDELVRGEKIPAGSPAPTQAL